VLPVVAAGPLDSAESDGLRSAIIHRLLFEAGSTGLFVHGFRFPSEVIVLAVRWYLQYGLSYRDVAHSATAIPAAASNRRVTFRVFRKRRLFP